MIKYKKNIKKGFCFCITKEKLFINTLCFDILIPSNFTFGLASFWTHKFPRTTTLQHACTIGYFWIQANLTFGQFLHFANFGHTWTNTLHTCNRLVSHRNPRLKEYQNLAIKGGSKRWFWEGGLGIESRGAKPNKSFLSVIILSQKYKTTLFPSSLYLHHTFFVYNLTFMTTFHLSKLPTKHNSHMSR